MLHRTAITMLPPVLLVVIVAVWAGPGPAAAVPAPRLPFFIEPFNNGDQGSDVVVLLNHSRLLVQGVRFSFPFDPFGDVFPQNATICHNGVEGLLYEPPSIAHMRMVDDLSLCSTYWVGVVRNRSNAYVYASDGRPLAPELVPASVFPGTFCGCSPANLRPPGSGMEAGDCNDDLRALAWEFPPVSLHRGLIPIGGAYYAASRAPMAFADAWELGENTAAMGRLGHLLALETAAEAEAVFSEVSREIGDGPIWLALSANHGRPMQWLRGPGQGQTPNATGYANWCETSNSTALPGATPTYATFNGTCWRQATPDDRAYYVIELPGRPPVTLDDSATYSAPGGGSAYQIVRTSRRPYVDARAYAAAQQHGGTNGTLASFESRGELDFVFGLYCDRYQQEGRTSLEFFYTSAQGSAQEQTWHWTSGPSTSTELSPLAPGSLFLPLTLRLFGGLECIIAVNGAKLNALTCNGAAPFVVEFQLGFGESLYEVVHRPTTWFGALEWAGADVYNGAGALVTIDSPEELAYLQQRFPLSTWVAVRSLIPGAGVFFDAGSATQVNTSLLEPLEAPGCPGLQATADCPGVDVCLRSSGLVLPCTDTAFPGFVIEFNTSLQAPPTAACGPGGICSCNPAETVVDCSGRGLIDLPRVLPNTTGLLDMSANELTALSLPSSNLDQLLTLDVSQNRIMQVDLDALRNRSSIPRLLFPGNPSRCAVAGLGRVACDCAPGLEVVGDGLLGAGGSAGCVVPAINFSTADNCDPPPPVTLPPFVARPTQPPAPAQTSSAGPLLVAVALSAVVGVAIVLLLLFALRRRRRNQARLSGFLPTSALTKQLLDASELEVVTQLLEGAGRVEAKTEFVQRRIAARRVELGRCIRQTAEQSVFETVVRPLLSDGEPRNACAVCPVDPDAASQVTFLARMRMLTCFNHVNVTPLLAWSDSPRLVACTPFMPHDLKTYLRGSRPTLQSPLAAVSGADLLGVARQLASALSYVHARGGLHGDLRAINVLVSAQGLAHVQLANFRAPADTVASPDCCQQLAPESLRDGRYTSSSEVYSLAVLFWEAMSFGKPPWGLASRSEICSTVLGGQQLPRPSLCNDDIFSLLSRCWRLESSQRPTITDVYSELAGLGNEEATGRQGASLLLLSPHWRSFEVNRMKLKFTREVSNTNTGITRAYTARGLVGAALVSQVLARLPPAAADETQVSEFLDEMQLLKALSHRNTVNLLGVCTSMQPYMMLFPAFEGRALDTLLRHEELSVDARLSVLTDVARGMTYLHGLRLIHRHLRASNCVLTGDYQTKILLVSMTRPLQDRMYYRVTSSQPVPAKWTAPERLLQGTFVLPSDVFAFAILMFEVLSGCRDPPYLGVSNEELVELLRSRRRLPALHLPPEARAPLPALFHACRQFNPPARPAFAVVLQQLELGRHGAAWNQIDRRRLVHLDHLGEGEFGFVLKMGLAGPDGSAPREVAVKQLRDECGQAGVADFLHEIELMERLQAHPNVVSFVGKCTLEKPYMLVLELATGGNFEDWLMIHPEATAADHLYLLWQVACGLSALHDLAIVHRDLATRNILIASNMVAKLSDFGLSRSLGGGPARAGGGQQYYVAQTTRRLPLRWLSPEALIEGKFGRPSDVWAFGVLIWEIYADEEVPFSHLDNDEYVQGVRSGAAMVLHPPARTPPPLADMLRLCLTPQPAHRCTAAHIAESISPDTWGRMRLDSGAALNTLYLQQQTAAAGVGGGGQFAAGRAQWEADAMA